MSADLAFLEDWGLHLPRDDVDHDGAERFASLYRHSNCLRLFRTRKGLLGVGTTSLRVGDSVCIVPGSRVPLIFRPTDADDKKADDVPVVKLVGACYLHGVMHGEAVLNRSVEFQPILVV